MTARILGLEMVLPDRWEQSFFSVIIGLSCISCLERKQVRQDKMMNLESTGEGRPLWQTGFICLMILILIVLNWAKPNSATSAP